ncbi:MAG TPA: HAD-IA family hydrolase [Terracidiphilus sp.]|jgi:putative hydrolase of the HAD superfamily
MFPFDVILFDVGGVLLTNGWDHCERTVVLDQFQLEKAEFERRHARANDAWERDALSITEYLDATVFYEPRSYSHAEFFSAMCAQSVELPNGGLGILQEVATSGRAMVGCLNNEARATNDYRFAQFGLRQYFDVALSSCYIGLRKPGAAIYQRALDILGRPGERILFIDDRAENVAAAAAAGMKTIRFDGADRLRQDLEYLTVL